MPEIGTSSHKRQFSLLYFEKKAMTNISLNPNAEGVVNWLKPVTDEEYEEGNKL